jgi:hypothetical protein
VPFGDAQDFVYRLDTFPGDPLLSEHGREHLAQGDAEPPGLQEESFGRLRVNLWKAEELGTALIGDNIRPVQKLDEPFPGKVRIWLGRVNKIDGESSAQQRQQLRSDVRHPRSLHSTAKPKTILNELTGKDYHTGYTREKSFQSLFGRNPFQKMLSDVLGR